MKIPRKTQRCVDKQRYFRSPSECVHKVFNKATYSEKNISILNLNFAPKTDKYCSVKDLIWRVFSWSILGFWSLSHLLLEEKKPWKLELHLPKSGFQKGNTVAVPTQKCPKGFMPASLEVASPAKSEGWNSKVAAFPPACLPDGFGMHAYPSSGTSPVQVSEMRLWNSTS